MLEDVRIAFRRLRRRPALTLLAVATLGLAIGAIVPLFALVNAFFLRPLPFAAPDRLVHLWATDTRLGQSMGRVSVPDYLDWREQARSFDDLAAFNYTSEDLTGGTEPERIAAGRVSANLIDMLGVPPEIGRGFRRGEDVPGAPKVAILLHASWQRRFGGDPGVVGRTLEIGGEPHEIVGVMPRSFVFPLPITEVLLPRVLDPATATRDRAFLQVAGRLREGVSRAEAQAEMDAIAKRLAARHPETNANAGVRIVPLREALNFAHEMFRTYSGALLAAELLVLAIACLNLSMLFLARVLSGRRELAVRVALGASRARLVRQSLIESAVIALLAGVGGLFLGAGLARGFEANVPADLYRVGTIGVDAGVVTATLLLALLAAALFGSLPALRAGRTEAAVTLKNAAQGDGSRDTVRTQRALVVAQIAIGVVLLVGTFLAVRSFSALQRVDLGFEPDGVATMLVRLPSDRYATREQRAAFHADVIERIGAIPGVREAATVTYLPLNHEMASVEVWKPGERPEGAGGPTASSQWITPGFFEVMGVRVLRGATFDASAGVGSEPQVVVNRPLAERMWPGLDPIGRALHLEGEDAPRRVVGVVGGTVHWELAGERPLQVYLPALAEPGSYFRVIARHEGSLGDALAGIRGVIAAIDPALAPAEGRSLRAVVEEYLMPHGMVVVALAVLSGGAIALAVMGIYGIMTFFVSRDRRAIGIRMAVGASSRAVVAEVLRRALGLAAWGAGIGLAGAIALGLVLEGALYGVSVRDPLTLAAVPLLLATVAVLASALPAWRASRIDPAETLRTE